LNVRKNGVLGGASLFSNECRGPHTRRCTCDIALVSLGDDVSYSSGGETVERNLVHLANMVTTKRDLLQTFVQYLKSGYCHYLLVKYFTGRNYRSWTMCSSKYYDINVHCDAKFTLFGLDHCFVDAVASSVVEKFERLAIQLHKCYEEEEKN